MQLNYKTFGKGDPVIILHGLFGTLDNWQTIGKRLAEEYMVFLIDQRNHGKSPHFSEHSYSLMANDLRTFMESEWLHQAYIIGHSMGGKTAMQFALDYPEMVEKLIVVDIGPNQNKSNHQAVFDAFFSVDIDRLNSRNEAASRMAERIEDPGVLQFLLKNLSRKKEGGFRWKMNLEALEKNYNAILAHVEGEDIYPGETLFIKGGKSDYLKETDVEEIRVQFPNAQMVTIPQAGHWVHAEAPNEFFKHIQQFLSI